jgi:hypothetical protein
VALPHQQSISNSDFTGSKYRSCLLFVLVRAKYQENKDQESRYDFTATGARVTVLPVAGTADHPSHCGANEEIPKLFIARGKNNRRDGSPAGYRQF